MTHNRSRPRTLESWFRPVAVTATLIAAVVVACSGSSEEIPSETKRAAVVQVATVEALDAPTELAFAGVSRAAARAEISFQIGGRLARRPAEIGDEVEEGQVLAQLEDKELRHHLEQAQATVRELETRLAQARRDAVRARELAASKAATSEEVERAESTLAALEATVAAARTRRAEAQRLLSETEIRAPYSGRVTEVLAEPGETVSPGRAILSLSGAGGLEVEIEVPEAIAARVEPDQAVRIDFPVLGRRDLPGRVTSLGQAAPRPGRLFPIVVSIDSDAALRPGLTAEVRLALAREAGLTVPVEAVINPGGREPMVFRLLADQTVERIPVSVGELLGDRVTVQGLSLGDRIVVTGQRALLPGERVEVGS